MLLTIGSRIGAYEITAALGAGGMGEVYRARDTRLGREAAIKILPDVFAASPERLARFEREARVLASLNHPNIAQVYGLEQAVDGRALVMEFVEGEDLAHRLLRGPLHEALVVARQIAEALEAAHEAGIVHRDLKPGNVAVNRLVRRDPNPNWMEHSIGYWEGDRLVWTHHPCISLTQSFRVESMRLEFHRKRSPRRRSLWRS